MNRLIDFKQYLSAVGRGKLPLIRQTEVAECGLASLAMIACYHGHRVDLGSLRRRYPVSLQGSTLADVIRTAEHLHLASRPVRVELEQLTRLQTPCILHWDMNHFVVLKSAGRRGVVVYDPARGERRLSLAQAGKHFTGVALELVPTAQFQRQQETVRLRLTELWANVRGTGSPLVQVLLLSLLLQLFVIAAPFYMQLVLDEVIVGRDAQLLNALALGFAAIVILQVSANVLRGYIVVHLSATLNLQMAINLFRHLLRLPMDYFQKRHIGDVISRFRSNREINDFITEGAVSAVVDGLMASITLAMMFAFSPQLALIVAAAALLYLTGRLALYRPLRSRTEEAVIAAAESDSNFMETVRGMQAVKIFGRERQRQGVWLQHHAGVVNADIRLGRLRLASDAFNGTVFGLENILVIAIGAGLILDGTLSVGMLVAFMAYKLQFTSRSAALIEQLIRIKMLDVHLERISDIALTPVEQDHAQDHDQQPTASRLASDGSAANTLGRLELRSVSYHHGGNETALFENVDLVVEPGETLALVGGSGSGKTTLLKIMLGLLRPDQGEVLLDGVNIYQHGLPHYRSQLSAVMQDDQLLSGSIADNICFFDSSPNLERVAQCAEIAAVRADIEAMPMAYNSLVGDMGTTLSGGQKQRILLARALYRGPRLLFLDEATSHLDVRLEATVNDNLRRLPMTTMMIAHRPETIRSADRVLSFDARRLIELDRRQLPPPRHPADAKPRPTSGAPPNLRPSPGHNAERSLGNSVSSTVEQAFA